MWHFLWLLMWSFNRNSPPSHHLTALISHPPQSNRPSLFPSNQRIYDCPYPLEAINMQSDYQMNKEHQFDRPLIGNPEYEAVYLPGLPPPPPPPPTDKPWQWQNSPIYGANGSMQYYPGYASYVHPVVDSWMTYRPLPPPVTAIQILQYGTAESSVRCLLVPIASTLSCSHSVKLSGS